MSTDVAKSFVERMPGLVESHIHEVSSKPHPYFTVRLRLDIFQGKGMHFEQRLKVFAAIQTWKIFAVVVDSIK